MGPRRRPRRRAWRLLEARRLGPYPSPVSLNSLLDDHLSIHLSPAYFRCWFKQGIHPRHTDIRIQPESG